MFDVNIVIVNYNMKDDIGRCLASLYQDIKDSYLNVNVVVVDNASTDGSGDFIRSHYPEVKYLEQKTNHGFGFSQNVGLSSAEAKYYFVLNPDTYFFPNEGSVKKLFDFMEKEPKIGIVGPKLLYPDGSLQYSCYRFQSFWQPLLIRTNIAKKKGEQYRHYFNMKGFDHLRTRPVDWVMGSAMFIRGSALGEVGKFDERFWMYFEDSDLCRRFWEKGWLVYYFPDVTIEHAHTRSSAAIPGAVTPLLKNKLARVHVASWIKYMWKWRGNNKFYESRKK
mgnify:CR=1 FL=1